MFRSEMNRRVKSFDAVEVDLLPAQEDAGEGLIPRRAHQLLHRLGRHGVAVDHLVPGVAVLTAEGDVAVKRKQVPHLSQHDLVPPGGQKQLDAPLAQGVEASRVAGRWCGSGS